MHRLLLLSAILTLTAPAQGVAQRMIPDSARHEAPAFTLPIWNADGDQPPATLSLADLRGQVVLLDFWARHCVPCVPIHQALVERAPEWLAQGVRIVSVLSWESPDGLDAFFQAAGGRPPFPVLLDRDGTLLEALDWGALPSAAILDHQGRIAWHRRGGMSPAVDLPRLLPSLLAARDGRPAPPDPNRLAY